MTNKEAIAYVKRCFEARSGWAVDPGDYYRRVLHLAEVLGKLKEHATKIADGNNFTPAYRGFWQEVLKEIAALESPPAPKPLKDQFREALDELVDVTKTPTNFQCETLVLSKPILDKIEQLRSKLGIAE